METRAPPLRTCALAASALSTVLTSPSFTLSEDERVALIHACVVANSAYFFSNWSLALAAASRLCDWTREAQSDSPRTRRLVEGGAVEALAVLARAAHAQLKAAACPAALRVIVTALHGAGNVAASPTCAAKEAFLSAGFVDICASVLHDAAALHPRVVAGAGRALGNACFGGAGAAARAAALRAGALAHAVGALRAHGGDRAASRWVAHAAGNLVYEGAPNAAQGEAAALGAAPLIATALRLHGDAHAATAGTLLDALANLVFRNEDTWGQAAAGSGGGGALLATALRLLRRHGVAAAGEPASGEPENGGGHAFFSACVFALVTLAEFEALSPADAGEALALARAHPSWASLRPWVRAAAQRLPLAALERH
jgi:hypothetical protein